MEVKFINGTRYINGLRSFPVDIYQFPFERHFNVQERLKWMETHWSDPIYWSAIYLILIVVGKVSSKLRFDKVASSVYKVYSSR